MVGAFFSVEGIDGCGKSTQLRKLYDRLTSEGHKAILTYEPGGTPLANKVREIFKDPANHGMDPNVELLLLNAARRDHVVRVIDPALAEETHVLSDRFEDATNAYQVHGRRKGDLTFAEIQRLLHTRLIGISTDRTYVFDIDPEVGRGRRAGGPPDRLDSEGLAFYQRVHAGYLTIAAANPHRIKIIDASRSVEEIHDEVYADAIRIIHERRKQ